MERPCPEDVVGVQGQTVDPMSVAGQCSAQNPILRSPHFYRPIFGRCVEQAQATPAHGRHRSRVTRERPLALPEQRVPDPDIAVAPRTRDATAVGVQMVRLPAQAVDPLFVSGHRPADLLSGLWIPNSNLAAFARARQFLAVRRPGDAQNPLPVAGACVHRSLCGQIPEPDGCVARSTRQLSAVGAEVNGHNSFGVAGHGARTSRHRLHDEIRLRLVNDVDDGLMVEIVEVERLL